MNKRLLWTGTLAIGVLLGSQYLSGPSSAQTPTESTAGEKKVERRKPLPDNFGKLGLTDSQKETLYATQAEYEKKIEALREQLKSLVRERDLKMEESLTDGQKLRLKELREAVKKKGAKPASDAADAK